MRKYKRYKRKFKIPLFIKFLFLLIILFAIFLFKIKPIIFLYAENSVETIVIDSINDIVQYEIYENRELYSEIIDLQVDSSNHVTAVKTDTILLSKIKAEILQAVYMNLDNLEEETLAIPLGNMLDATWFGGMGPKINIGMTALGTAYVEFVSSFTDAGINQTRHNVIIEITVEADILTVFGSERTEIKSDFMITDTIIVGNVPEQYGYINLG